MEKLAYIYALEQPEGTIGILKGIRKSAYSFIWKYV